MAKAGGRSPEGGTRGSRGQRNREAVDRSMAETWERSLEAEAREVQQTHAESRQERKGKFYSVSRLASSVSLCIFGNTCLIVHTVHISSKFYWYIIIFQMEEAEEVFQHMRNGNIYPDTVSFNVLISGYAKMGDIKKAFKLFNDVSRVMY